VTIVKNRSDLYIKKHKNKYIDKTENVLFLIHVFYSLKDRTIVLFRLYKAHHLQY